MDTNLNQFLTNIADAIRSKKGTTEKINAQDFVQEIESIEGGSVVANNGVPILIENEEQYNELLNSPETEDLDKIYDYNGQLLKLYSSDTTEERTLEIDKNGEYSVVQYDKVNVNYQDMLQARIDATNNCDYLFYKYGGRNVDFISDLDTSNVTSARYMFSQSEVETIPLLNTGNIVDMSGMFNNCFSLRTVPRLNVSNVDYMGGMFSYCICLDSILMYGMKVNFDISAGEGFKREDLVIIINNLAEVTTSRTLKMGSTNLAKLTKDDIAIANAKNWTLA